MVLNQSDVVLVHPLMDEPEDKDTSIGNPVDDSMLLSNEGSNAF